MSTRDARQFVTKYRPEISLSVAVLCGWYFLASAVSSLSFVSAGVVWRVSAGLLLLSLCGWRLLFKIASHGLYTLTRD